MLIKKPFKGLKVVELAGVLAGPSAGAFLAELGAQVIKVENKKTKGDITRTWKLPTENANQLDSAYFWSVNKGKKSVFLDLENSVDKAYCLSLIKNADVVLVNFKKQDYKKFNLSYSTLRKINPSLIYASITGFGENSERTAFDLILQAESGFMYLNSVDEHTPMKLPVALIDVLAGHHLKEGILIGLREREKTGKGLKISVSLYDAAISSLVNQSTNWLIAKNEPKPIGSLHPNIAPYGEIFTTYDKQKITFAVGSDKQFDLLCDVLQLESLSNNEKFKTNQQRVKNRKTLFKLLQNKIEKTKMKNIFSTCLKYDIPIARIRKVSEAINDQVSRSMISDGKIKTIKHFAGKLSR